MVKAVVDIKSALNGLEKLASPALRESLLRSMLVAGGKVIRDEAKLRVPVKTGRLQAMLYLAHSPEKSLDHTQTYHVSWRKGHGRMGGGAPYGHLVEFGHWQTHKAYLGKDGAWHSTKVPLPEPRWIAARPFLRPALDSAGAQALAAMVERGRERLPELLVGVETEIEQV